MRAAAVLWFCATVPLCLYGQDRGARVAWVPNPRVADATWVSDASGHLRPATRDSLNRIISALERETGAEIAVVVVDSLAGLVEQEFALAIHRAWGVGKRERDNGIVFLWAPNDRGVYISVGYGLEGVLPDRRAGRIRDRYVFAAFRESRFDEGVLSGVTALAAAAREAGDPAAVARVRAERDDDDGGGMPILPVAGGVLGLGAAGLGGAAAHKRWKRRRPRPCPRCGATMRLLDEQADDAHLDEGAQAEERVKSVDWDVWLCPSCEEALLIPYERRGSGHSECRHCRRRTAKLLTYKQTRAPTTTSTGLGEAHYTCKHCKENWVVTSVVPKVVPQRSSSGGGSGFSSGGGGGGGSSFGGGSAGGGGAGGKY